MRDLSVVASVGSAAFADAGIAGQNDGTRARRSPGSTLKPFIYALAIDQGLVHPMTVLKDTPQAFGAQSPENFDGEFAGPVTVQEALVRSRNVPAVAVGLQLREPGLRDFLLAGGVARLEDASHYGLALYLGGAEVTMRELAGLYATLANGGLWRPLRDERGAPAVAPRRLLSEAASYVTLDMLAGNPRPAQAFANSAVRAAGPVYWKTGTSNGFRDAWSAGVFDHYVLVVWVGHFDGRPNPAFVGVQTAAPLFFQLVDALRATRRRDAGGGALAAADRPASMLRPPAALRRVAVCADSGDLPNAWCPRTVETWYLPGVSPIRVSTLHRALRIDRRSGLLACPGTPPEATRTEVHEFWSSDMLEQFERAGLPRRRPPAADPACAATSLAAADRGAARAPEITSPLARRQLPAARRRAAGHAAGGAACDQRCRRRRAVLVRRRRLRRAWHPGETRRMAAARAGSLPDPRGRRCGPRRTSRTRGGARRLNAARAAARPRLHARATSGKIPVPSGYGDPHAAIDPHADHPVASRLPAGRRRRGRRGLRLGLLQRRRSESTTRGRARQHVHQEDDASPRSSPASTSPARPCWSPAPPPVSASSRCARSPRQGASVLGTGRTLAKAREACSSVGPRCTPLELELESLDSVRACADAVRALGTPIDVLMLNAGIMSLPKLEQVNGIEKQFAVNHLGHFLLAHRLLDQVKAAPQGRVVTMSSSAYKWAPPAGIEFDNLSGARDYDGNKAYGIAKTANGLFSLELARRLAGTTTTSNSVNPGAVNTNLMRHLPSWQRQIFTPIAKFLVKPVEVGAATQVYVATAPALAAVSGYYFEDCNPRGPRRLDEQRRARPAALGEVRRARRRLPRLSLHGRAAAARRAGAAALILWCRRHRAAMCCTRVQGATS